MMIFKRVFAVAGLSLVAGVAMADCTYLSPTTGSLVRTQPLLGGNLTVGRDVPLGAEIYRQTFTSPVTFTITCTAGIYNIETRRTLPVTPLALSSWVGTPYGGNVYQTGVPGIGVAIWFSGHALPYSNTDINCGGGTAACNVTIGNGIFIDMSFIKIGDVSPGTIQGASLPTMLQQRISSNTLEIQRVNFSGSINIVSRTCSTPDVNVPMGSHMLSEFSGPNTFTPWKDFAIALNNCPAFNGYYQDSGPRWASDGTVSNLDARKNNVLQVRLDPTRAPINAALGILSLNPSAPGDDPAATGVGVQVGDSTGAPLVLANLRSSGITTRAEEGASYSIPLSARYIQTESDITAGPANATATFTINYY
ncbi:MULTISPECIES: fimbrial protein [unclassified Pseudomonas]|uniref:fimbrial protein n=1 Tax=unclassified Pseudomonas TaxID=196821 RepID=UPI0015A2C2BB|nr:MULTISPECIES: fimbrial protein [unclassified Pseudomonas]NWC96540.1 type 1 fimbrial protein [Pseudomonas sp. IPO3779]NWD17299.1 type 1 fimbrial protein [Pseudomonas sp. IPO3778]